MSEVFSDLQCGLTNDHVVNQPINLSCGHCICKTCVPDQTIIICKICSIETNRSELKVDIESVYIKNRIKNYIYGLFDDLEKRATDEIKTIKILLENRELTLNHHFKYIEEELEIRIESIKINLDDLFGEFKKELVEIKKDIIEIQNDALNGARETNYFENNLNVLRDYIKNNQSKTEEKFYEYQENFKNIKIMSEKFQDAFYSCKLYLKLPSEQIDKKLIGEIMFEDPKRSKIKEILLNGNFETIPIKENLVSLIDLPNGNLVCGTDESVILFSENLENIKSFSTGGSSYCAINRRNEIYVSVCGQHCIYLFDLNLNQLKKFGRNGTADNQLNGPEGVCCHEDFLYICDYSNVRIQILTLDFEYVKTIQLDSNPYRIQISKTTIAVSCDQATLFFDLNSGTLKSKQDYGTYHLNYIHKTFYASRYRQKKFFCFDLDGNYIEEIAMNEKSSGSLCRNKEALYIIDYDNKLLKLTKI